MAPKNKQRNSFYFFMKEIKEREAARGAIIAMRDLPDYAHPRWKKLSAAEREPYEEMARQYKNDPSLRGGKLASDGTRVEDNLREEEEKEWEINTMKQNVKYYCNSDCTTIEEFKELSPKRLHYFMSFNILCHKDNSYIPIEVGIVEYSIQYGIHREYTKILNPGRPPTGYAGEAKKISEEKHQIDIFGEKDSEKDMRLVYEEIKSFTNPTGVDEYPPIFCEESSIEITRGCLNWFAKITRSENVFDVWNAAYLLLELRAGIGQPLPSLTIAADLLNKTSFNYHPSTRCSFHEERDIHFCALAYSKRLCYLLSDAICHLFDVPLTERHIPSRAVEEKAYSVTVFKDRTYPADRVRLDKVTTYYENEDEDNDEQTRNAAKRKIVPRQPASACVAEEMSRLRLNMDAATVPGHGIGRGLRRKP